MSEEESSSLRDKIESIQGTLKNAAGEWDDLGDRVDNIENWIKGITIDNGVGRLEFLEEQANDMKADLQIAKCELKELIAKEAEAFSRSLNDASYDKALKINELTSELDRVKKLLENQSHEITELELKFEKVAGRQIRDQEDFKSELKEVLRDFATVGDVNGSLQVQARRYNEQICDLQKQVNTAHIQIDQLQQLVARPSASDKVLGCLLVLALIVGSVWLAVKVFNWVAELVR